MYTHELHDHLRYINWRIQKVLNETTETQLSSECRGRMVDLSIAICRIVPLPFCERD